jgi:hypothetical protein
MPESDKTLADIDSMLADYIPPSHLALVATPEEAEILGHDPHYEDDFAYWEPSARPVTANTWALAQGRSRNVDRSRAVEQGLMYILQHELQRRFGGPVTATIYRTDTFTVYVDVSNGELDVRYLMDDDVRYDILRFRPSRIRHRGSEIQLPSGMTHYEYAVLPDGPLSRFANPFANPAELAVTPIRRVLDLTPIRISMEAAHQVRGYMTRLQVLDEVAQFTEGMRRVGEAGQRASELLEEFRQNVVRDTLAHVSLPQEEAPSRPSAPAPFIRSGLNGQRSPYGPPSRGRRTH